VFKDILKRLLIQLNLDLLIGLATHRFDQRPGAELYLKGAEEISVIFIVESIQYSKKVKETIELFQENI
jgi:hypothetical protein